MLALLALLACAKDPSSIPQVQTGGDPVPSVSPAPGNGVTESPFSVEQLRSGFAVGTKIRLAINAVGEPERFEQWDITATDASGMTIASRSYAADGSLLKDDGSGTSTWEELRMHAVFPASQTVREEVKLTTDLGEFDCWLYTVVDPQSDTVKRLWFAKTLPGPPLLFTIVAGKGTVFEMRTVGREPLP